MDNGIYKVRTYSPRTNSRGVADPFEFIFRHLRGAFLLSRMYDDNDYGCLLDLIGDLEAVEMPYREVSDIEDYKYIEENIYDIPLSILEKELGHPKFCIGQYHVVVDCEKDLSCRCGSVIV